MFTWLNERLLGIRINNNIKSVNSYIQSVDKAKNNELIAITAALSNDYQNHFPELLNMINDPLIFERNDLINLYEILDKLQVDNRLQLIANIKTMKDYGDTFPQVVIDHAERISIAIEFIMVTIACGLKPKIKNKVKSIWSISECPGGYLNVIYGIRKLERSMIAVGAGPMFGELDDGRWSDMCGFFPTFLELDDKD